MRPAGGLKTVHEVSVCSFQGNQRLSPTHFALVTADDNACVCTEHL
jgi:hypothetical protein